MARKATTTAARIPAAIQPLGAPDEVRRLAYFEAVGEAAVFVDPAVAVVDSVVATGGARSAALRRGLPTSLRSAATCSGVTAEAEFPKSLRM